MVDQWVSCVSIESMGEFCIGVKIVYSISIEKPVWVWKVVNLQDVNNVIVWFFTYFISFECTCLTDALNAEHSQKVYS